jgi:hypothetical protein
MKLPVLRNIISSASLLFGVALAGCGTVQDGTYEEEEWNNTPPVSVTARLEYRIDSLTNENRRLHQQLDAITTENQNLSNCTPHDRHSRL